ncbi:MAG TPA: EAL domain-containing protein [Sphingomicrobium sp.]|nr:EAL domain-containing protein [Sphingomicrobium sp.]
MLSRVIQRMVATDVATGTDRSLVEERYWSLRRQVPIIYVLGLVNLSAMELAATGHLAFGINLPTFIGVCGIIRLWHWFGVGKQGQPTHRMMARRMRQTVWVAAVVCIAVCARSMYLLLTVGDSASRMAVVLLSGLTGIGVAYGLTALPAAGRIPLILIVGPISAAALLSKDPHFAGAAFGLVAVAVLTMRLLAVHSQHLTDLIRSRSTIAREQEQVEEAHLEAVVAATTDFLTGLPNRRAFVAALDAAISKPTGSFALAILDLDRFKGVNDTFGHATGDQLLREVAARLSAATGRRGIVARLGGDEFGVLVPLVERPIDAEKLGAEILTAVNGPAFIKGREFGISASCGIAISRKREHDSPSRLMADADLALYQAKANPGRGVAIFELCMEAPRRRRVQIERALQAPGFKDHLSVVFQPIFDLKSGSIVANEALARWTDPELGSVTPSEFVPIAEQLHRINEINEHLMAIAFRAARAWPDHVKLSFNLSAIQLCSPGLAELVLAALQSSDLPAARLQAEVTETALLADFDHARINLTQLKKAGATIVLDDFGAGYASIGYLRELYFDQIKLDGGLVTAAQHSADGRRLLRAVIGLCEILGVSTVAEHVESEELLALVTELGCTAGQGFWLESPLSSIELEDRLQATQMRRRFPRRAA